MALTKVTGSGLATGAATDSLVGIADNATSTKLTISDTNITGAGAFTSTSIDATKLTGALPAIDGSALTNLPGGGKVLQVLQSQVTSHQSFSSASWVDVSGLSVTITPSATASKVMLDFHVQVYQLSGANEEFRVVRNGVEFVNGITSPLQHTASGYFGSGTVQNAGFKYLDSPSSTSAQTYKIQIRMRTGTSEIGKDWNADTFAGIHTITASEIGV